MGEDVPPAHGDCTSLPLKRRSPRLTAMRPVRASSRMPNFVKAFWNATICVEKNRKTMSELVFGKGREN